MNPLRKPLNPIVYSDFRMRCEGKDLEWLQAAIDQVYADMIDRMKRDERPVRLDETDAFESALRAIRDEMDEAARRAA